jgi:endonuclease/exonuclease/phosphatase family metal-dependent hydrolase
MTFKYIQLNIWMGGMVWDNMVEFFHQENPDILVMQEVYEGHDPTLDKRFRTVEVLREELNMEHSYSSPYILDVTDNVNIPLGNAILSKFPIIRTKTVPYNAPYREFSLDKTNHKDFPNTPRNVQHAVIQLPDNTEINVFNTHGIWGFDGLDNSRRDNMSKVLLETIDHAPHSLLSGDFNTFYETNAMRAIGKEMKNIFEGELQSSFNLEYKKEGNFAHSVVDMIFASHDLKIVEKKAPQVSVSDHMPLVVVVEI